MSFLAQLSLEEEVYNVIHCTYHFEQDVDRNHKPSGIPRGGRITLLIEARGNSELLRWMVDPAHTKDGKITFFRRDEHARLFHLRFQKAYCIEYHEHFNHDSNVPMQIQLCISVQKMHAEKAAFENKWPVTL
ncbi:type VI secretion system tube protein TssD [Rapidithrix thailandica]|uniref:Type VI secretion system tube protein TssD n=1 Tax=Rapidithrix thailandica TaxID=413964 RepID=A0AAW9SE10_9BACT